MQLPYLKESSSKSKKYIVQFGGINRSGTADDGEFENTLNISDSRFPYLSQCGEIIDYSFPEANETTDAAWRTIFAHDRLMYNNSDTLFYETENRDGTRIKKSINGANLSDGIKNIAQVGNVTCVFPDMRCFNFKDETSELMQVNLTVPQEEKRNREWWSYYRATSNSLIIDNCTGSEWEQPGTYADSAAQFKDGDVVTVSAFSCATNTNVLDKVGAVKNAVIETVTYDNGKTTIKFKGEKIFGNLSDRGQMGHSEITVSKEMPTMQYICSHGGRLWGGCDDENTINASAYNEPRVFNRFEGLSSDSYSISTQTPGNFTGCIGMTTYVCFFKENYILRVYGNRPAAFSLVETEAPGVQSGSEKSLVKIGEVLYYKGVNGVYAYTGGTPVCISRTLGDEQYSEAAAVAYDNKYYISMKNSRGVREIYSYSPSGRVWLRICEGGFLSAAVFNNKLYYIDAEDNKIKVIDKNAACENVEWFAELAEMTEIINEKKSYSKIMLRYEIERGAYMDIEVSYDRGIFRKIKTVYGDGQAMQSIYLPPHRCDSFKIRLSGKGGCLIKDIVRVYTERSDF